MPTRSWTSHAVPGRAGRAPRRSPAEFWVVAQGAEQVAARRRSAAPWRRRRHWPTGGCQPAWRYPRRRGQRCPSSASLLPPPAWRDATPVHGNDAGSVVWSSARRPLAGPADGTRLRGRLRFSSTGETGAGFRSARPAHRTRRGIWHGRHDDSGAGRGRRARRPVHRAVPAAGTACPPCSSRSATATSLLPRAPGLQARDHGAVPRGGVSSKEIRALEMGDSHPYFEGGIIQVAHVRRDRRRRSPGGAVAGRPAVSPERVMGCGQDRYEKVLVAKAREAGCEVRFGTRLTSLRRRTTDGVTAVVSGPDRAPYTIRAHYVVAARRGEQLRPPRAGRGALRARHRLQRAEHLLPRARAGGAAEGAQVHPLLRDGRPRHADGPVPAARMRPVAGDAPLLPRQGRETGGLHRRALRGHHPHGRRARRPRRRDRVRRCRGRARNWSPSASASSGCSWPATPRTSHPPAGGFGANTGIHDAHNLALEAGRRAARLGRARTCSTPTKPSGTGWVRRWPNRP